MRSLKSNYNATGEQMKNSCVICTSFAFAFEVKNTFFNVTLAWQLSFQVNLNPCMEDPVKTTH